MTDILLEYLLFAAKTATLAVALVATAAILIALTSRGRARARGRLEVKRVNERYRDMARALAAATLKKRELKRHLKQEKAAEKSAEKQPPRSRVFVLSFEGDMRASGTAALREEITAILTVARPEDEVVVRIESAGGWMHAYGLAASQLARIRERKISLTVTVDKVAASGGYLMACVADRVLAAPFAAVGSIGVVGQLPNLHRLLKKHDVDIELHTAGKYKRTLTLLGENTDEGRRKFQEDLNTAHDLFQRFVAQWRPQVHLDTIATGEHWFGDRAKELQLVDDLCTSDDYLMQASARADVFELRYQGLMRWTERLGAAVERTMTRVGDVVGGAGPNPFTGHR